MREQRAPRQQQDACRAPTRRPQGGRCRAARRTRRACRGRLHGRSATRRACSGAGRGCGPRAGIDPHPSTWSVRIPLSRIGCAGRRPRRDVGEQVAQHDHPREQEARRHDHGVVALEDRVHDTRPMPGHAKITSTKTAPLNRNGRYEPEQRDDRDQRVAQRVLDDDRALGQPLRARGPDVVLANDLEHSAARVSRDPRGEHQRRAWRRAAPCARCGRGLLARLRYS